jgi:hypothetical protein
MLSEQRRFYALAAAVILAACGATVDKTSVRASPGPAESERVAAVQIPYNSSLPTFLLTVKPFEVGAGGQVSAPAPSPQGPHYYGSGPMMLAELFWHFSHDPAPVATGPSTQILTDRIGLGVAAQLETALGHAGNVQLLSYEHLQGSKGNHSRRTSAKERSARS